MIAIEDLVATKQISSERGFNQISLTYCEETKINNQGKIFIRTTNTTRVTNKILNLMLNHIARRIRKETAKSTKSFLYLYSNVTGCDFRQRLSDQTTLVSFVTRLATNKAQFKTT
jgi:hypothetical protein